jgi:Spy/CpxP family protein refolding chaperone
LNLNDDQARQLQASDRKFTQQRNQVLQSERQARLGLKAEMDSNGTRDQAKIDGYMQQLVAAQHRRADILEAEQKEMSGYLTPLQRAQYQALHEQLNKRVVQLRQNAPPTP